MKRIFAVFILVLSFGNCFAQMPSDRIDAKNLNKAYLEHLIKLEIDGVRSSKGIKALLNDSILFVAAKHHAKYLNKEEILDHFEPKSPKWLSPQNRAEYFGAKNYQVGENVARMPIGTNVKLKTGTVNTTSYGSLAEAFRIAWVNSPGHYANIITSEYDITGVSLEVDDEGNVRCVQKFACVNEYYQFHKSPSVFPYADLPPAELTKNYVKNNIIRHKHHAYKIKETKKDKICADCGDEVFLNNSVEIRFSDDSLFLCIRKKDIPKVKSYFKKKWDGLAYEIELFDFTYSCDLQNNVRIPTRKNGMCEFDGIVTQPLYKKDILDSIAKQEAILRRNRTRLHRDECLQICLGKYPEKAKGQKTALNLLIIKKRRICRVINTNGICGSPLRNTLPKLPVRHPLTLQKFEPKLKAEVMKFRVDFEQNSTDFQMETIMKHIQELKEKNVRVTKAYLKAFASVEGTSEINQKLFQKRGANIIQLFEKYQDQKINFEVTTKENWDMFFRQITGTPYEHLKDLDTTEVRAFVNDSTNVKALEKYFAKERYVFVKMITKPILTEASVPILAYEEYLRLIALKQRAKSDLIRLSQIQEFLYASVKDSSISGDTLRLEIPEKTKITDLMKYQQAMYWYQTNRNDIGAPDLLPLLKPLLKSDPKNVEFIYNYLAIGFNFWKFNTDKLFAKKTKQLTPLLTDMGATPDTIHAFPLMLDHLIVNSYFNQQGGKLSRVRKCLDRIHDEYLAKDSTQTEAFKFQLAQYYIFTKRHDWAFEYLSKLCANPKTRKNKYYTLYLKTSYAMQYKHSTDRALLEIMSAIDHLSSKEWCNLFNGPCGIDFHIFDYQPLRNLYCEQCR